MFGRAAQLIEDGSGKLSTPPTAAIVVVLVLCTAVLYNTFQNRPIDVLIGGLGTIVTLLYGIKKLGDNSVDKAQIKADAAPPPPPVNTTNINNPDKVTVAGDASPKINVQNIEKTGSLTKNGNVNVTHQGGHNED